jgi:hypothetical protein
MYIRNMPTFNLHPWEAATKLAIEALAHQGAFGTDVAALISDLSVGENLTAAIDAFMAAEAIHGDYDPDQEWATWAAYLAAQPSLLVGV